MDVGGFGQHAMIDILRNLTIPRRRLVCPATPDLWGSAGESAQLVDLVGLCLVSTNSIVIGVAG